MVSSYNPAVYEKLPHFAALRLEVAKQQTSLRDIGQVICQFGLKHVIGLALLHKHFNLSRDERLVEAIGANQLQIKPQIIDAAHSIIPYLWKLHRDRSTGKLDWFPLEFCLARDLPQVTREHLLEMTTNRDFLSAIATKFCELNVMDVFGVTILHRDTIELTADEILVETTDEPGRTLTWRPWSKSAFSPQKLTPTTWQFDSHGQMVEVHNCGHCHHS